MSQAAETMEKLTPGKPPVPICRRSTSNSPNSSALQLPSPIITRRTRTASTSARALENPIVTGIVKSFSRTKGHGFITPTAGGEDLFCHISDIEGEYVPMPGDEVKYRLCAIPPKNEKFQAVHVKIINFSPEVHRRWEDSY
ncbi:cold shock domain-containing protein CG9705 [Glossina fuscipes]|uniref:Cold shock domain-containing protein CG9705 n=1 Tax=Glossina fuscipes TaxID=7396 RepID=A0A8U0W425_9MUSC|nr:cold shock domain-containing protein CG9705 [Glossina fuscipes]